MITAIILIAKALLAVVLSLFGIAACFLPFYRKTRRRKQGHEDPRPGLAARDRSEYVRKAMRPDDVPVPGKGGRENVDIDILWKRRN